MKSTLGPIQNAVSTIMVMYSSLFLALYCFIARLLARIYGLLRLHTTWKFDVDQTAISMLSQVYVQVQGAFCRKTAVRNPFHRYSSIIQRYSRKKS